MPITGPTATAGARFALELDNTWMFLSAARGGLVVSDVVEEKLGADHITHKHLAGIKYTDIEFSCGISLSDPFHAWIEDTVAGRYTRKSGAIVALDYDGRERSRVTFTDALFTEMSLPALDSLSKDAGRLYFKLSPGATRLTTSSTGVAGPSGVARAQKAWLPANFTVGLDGTPLPTRKVAPIDIRMVVAQQLTGEARDYQTVPAHLEFSDLVVTVPERSAKVLYDWHEDFVVRGNQGREREKTAKVELLAADHREVLATLTFTGLGIYKIAAEDPPEGDGTREATAAVTASMYCEEISFSARSSAQVGSAPSGTSAPSSQPQAVAAPQPAGIILSGEYPGQFTRLRTTN